jgi:hypothetical protein
MSLLRKREVTTFITIVLIIIILTNYYITVPMVSEMSNLFLTWAIIISSVALWLGVLNVLLRWIPNIKKKEGEWYFQIWGIFVILFMVITGISTPVFGQHPWFLWIYNNIQMPLDAAIYSLLGFYIASAVFRAFRARTLEAGVFLIAGIFLLTRNAPIMEYLMPGQSTIGNWINDYPSMAARRGIILTVALGSLAFIARTLIGRERSTTM